MEQWPNDNYGGGEANYSDENSNQCHFFLEISYMCWLRIEPGIRRDTPATNRQPWRPGFDLNPVCVEFVWLE